MKRISFNLLLISFLSLACIHVNALGTKVINITTGIDNSNSGQQVAYGAFDNNWTVKLPGNTNYQPVEATSCLSYGAGCNNNIRWLCPGGNPLASAAGGDYYYRIVFFYDKNSCPVQSAVINLNYVGADNTMNQIMVNNNPHTVGITFNPFLSNQVITLATSEIVHGQNEIVIRVNNYANSQTGMEIYGNVTITNSASFYFDLEDQNGHNKNQFCLGAEDVLIDGGYYPTNSVNAYSVDLGIVNGANITWIGQIGLTGGAPISVNITNYFQNLPTPIVFQTGVTYRIKLKINSLACGLVESTYDFTYACCDNSTPDPTFSLSTSNTSTVKGESKVMGNHTWNVYSAYGSNGPFSFIGTYNNKTFSKDAIGPCYYVKHTVSNECGEACDAQIICNSNCDDMECPITPAINLNFDLATNQFTWDQVSGAAYYLIEITLDDPACCSSSSSGPDVMHAPKTIYCPINSHTLDYSVDLNGQFFRCFSWRVITICPNGTRSVSASKCVMGGPQEGYGKTGFGNTGIGEKSLGNEGTILDISPNPTKGLVSIDIVTANDIEFNISVFDQNGKMIKTFETMKTMNKKSSIKWNTESLSKGEYVVKMATSSHQIINKKLIIE